MGRKRKSFYRDKSRALEANQESRSGRVLKIFRQVDPESAQLIGGGLLDLSRSEEDMPDIKTSMAYNVFLFDPRLLPKNVNPILIAGVRIGQLAARIERSEDVPEAGYDDVALGEPRLLGNRRTILVSVESEQARQERAGIYRILGDSGIKGFTSAGRQRGHRQEAVHMAIGTFNQPVARADEPEFMERIQTTLEMQLLAQGGHVSLGELQVRSYQPK